MTEKCTIFMRLASIVDLPFFAAKQGVTAQFTMPQCKLQCGRQTTFVKSLTAAGVQP
jgi:hypothetical protein